jgi:hypothetical protein
MNNGIEIIRRIEKKLGMFIFYIPICPAPDKKPWEI